MPERVDVGALLDVHAAALLGRHVRGRSHHDAGLRALALVGVAHQLGDAEVEQLGVRIAVLRLHDPDVVGLEIAVDDPLPVRRLQRLADLAQQPPRLVGLERAALQAIGQALAVEKLHREVVALVGQPPEREDVDDVRVADLVDGARLVDEPAHQLRVRGDVRRQNLDRDALADHGLDGRVDRPHPALADLAEDAVLADLEPLGQIARAGGATMPPVDRRIVGSLVLGQRLPPPATGDDDTRQRQQRGQAARRLAAAERAAAAAAATAAAAPRSALPSFPLVPGGATAPPPPPLPALPPCCPGPAPPSGVQVFVKIVQPRGVLRLAGADRPQRFVVKSWYVLHAVSSPLHSMVPQASSSAGIWLQRPTPSQALHRPQVVPDFGYWQCAWPSHMPPHLPDGSLWLSMHVGLFVPAGSGMQLPVLSQVPQWLQSVLQQTPTVAFSGIAQLPLSTACRGCTRGRV